MKIYDALICETRALLSGEKPREYAYAPENCAPEGKKNALILLREAAFELGESRLPSLSYLAITDNEALIPEDRVLLYGKDLTELRGDAPFARLTFLLTDAIEEAGEQAAYSLIQELELKRYELAPEGCMLRAPAFSNREQLRVSKSAVKAGLSFAQLGSLFIRKYKENPHVKAVVVIFITLPAAPYAALDALASRSNDLTRALNHIFEDANLDCHACAWKPVCDEVEGMKGLHRQMAKH
jgi:hypothetical protein